MRRETSIDADWFERLYAEQGDPWGFETSPYERAKYDHTLASLPQGRFDRALEVGCANGVLTERLAPRCEALLAVDVSDTALTAARARLAGQPHVEVARMRLPGTVPDGRFDLVLLSEVAYYWDGGDLLRAGRWMASAIRPGGHLLLVHWTGETDYPRTGDEAVAELLAALEGEQRVVVPIVTDRRERYRLDLWRL